MEEELCVKDEGHKKDEEVKVTINKSIINLFSQDINAASVNMLCVCVCVQEDSEEAESFYLSTAGLRSAFSAEVSQTSVTDSCINVIKIITKYVSR